MKRLLKILCCVSLIFIFQFSDFNPAQAQRIHGLVSSGATLSQIEGDELKGFRLLGYSGGVGALAALDRNERWSISLEALFSQRGSYNASNNPYSVALNLNYIDIPTVLSTTTPTISFPTLPISPFSSTTWPQWPTSGSPYGAACGSTSAGNIPLPPSSATGFSRSSSTTVPPPTPGAMTATTIPLHSASSGCFNPKV